LASRSAAYLLAGDNPNQPEVRDRVSLAIYLTQPRSAEEYVADLRRPGSQDVVDAMRRIVGTDIGNRDKPHDGLDPNDINLITRHSREGYEVSIRRAPETQKGTGDRQHAVYRCGVSEGEIKYTKPPMEERLRSMASGRMWRHIATPPRPMTLLEHSCSHLLFILDQRDRWIRRCHRETRRDGDATERCPVFFAVFKPKRKTCGTSRCKMLFDSPEAQTSNR
jgi:hypothetical protein